MATARLTELAGSGPALLLVHGFGSDTLSWAGLVAGLSTSHRLFAVDLPGHGKAPAEVGDGSVATLSAAVEAAIAELPRPFGLVGHSLGGAVAVDLARRMGGDVSALTLIAPAGFGLSLDAHFLDAYPEAKDEEALRPLLLRLVSREVLIQPPMIAHVLNGLARPGRREALRQIAAALHDLPPAGELPEGLPAQLIWGAEDEINPVPAHLAERYPGAVQMIPRTGHMPHVEAATQVTRLIRAFPPTAS